MVKSFFKKLGLALIAILMVQMIAYAQSEGGGNTGESEPKNPADASFKSRCDSVEDLKFPECATSPSKCGSVHFILIDSNDINVERTPFNCLFLQEPIGGKTGYDLYKIVPGVTGNKYTLWRGEALVGEETGPFQAILTYEKGKESQGPFGLLYNYLALIYNFLSGIIIAFAVLVIIIGGIRMSVSAGADGYTEAKKMIIKALVGMVLWFTASIILYTINPTFFSF